MGKNELVRATSVRKVMNILGSKTLKDFKRDLIKCTNLDKKLQDKEFDISRFWSETPKNSFEKYGNDSKLIKK